MLARPIIATMLLLAMLVPTGAAVPIGPLVDATDQLLHETDAFLAQETPLPNYLTAVVWIGIGAGVATVNELPIEPIVINAGLLCDLRPTECQMFDPIQEYIP